MPTRHHRAARRARHASALLLAPLATPLGAAAVATPLVALPAASAAQPPAAQGTIAGTVVSQGSEAPLADVQIRVAGTLVGTTTDAGGRFRLVGVRGTDVTLQVRRIGYAPREIAARVGDESVRVVLAAQATSLEQVVVTGTPGETQRRALGNAVTQIDASAVTQIAPVQSMQQLLNGRAPGVVVMPTSGAVGTGSQVRVRGVASFSLGNNPLLYVDGVRINNSAATGPANQSFGSSPISRLNDINPDDIESIEVLKGPSAATLYGTEASNGVISIITKRGASGNARWSGTLRQGVNYLKDWEHIFPTNYGVSPVTNTVVALSMDSLRVGNYGQDLFRNGHHQESQLSVSGGTGAFQYFADGGLLDSQGAEPSNAVRRYNGRLNLGITPSSKLRVSSNFAVVTGPTDLSAEAGFGGRVWTTILATPTNYNNPVRHGFYSGIPIRYDEVYHFTQNLDHYIGSTTIEHQPLPWLRQRLALGIDRTREGNVNFQPRVDSLVSDPSFGSDALGARYDQNVTTSYRTFDYAATATWHAMPSLSLATSAGAQYYRTSVDSLYASGTVFPTPGLSSINATTTNKSQGGDAYSDATLGYYVQEQLTWRDRLYATAALRIDKSSAFGANFNRVYYPKYSLSYVASDDGWWTALPWVGTHVSSLRLRGAYGEAGKAPGTFDAQRSFRPVSGPGDSPGVTPNVIGNPDLGPERGKEFELGFDAGAFGDRLGAEVTYYHKKTTDAILFRQLSPSIGFSGTQPFNAGSLLNQGWELALHGTPYRSRQLTWDLGASFATNDNEVLSLLPGTDFVTVATFSSGPNVRHQVGHPAFAFYDRVVVAAAVGADGKVVPSSVQCDDGKGGTTPCYNAAGQVVAPLVYRGRTVPPTEGALNTTVTFLRNFKLYTQVDMKTGQLKVDGNTRVRCFFFGGRCTENFFPTTSDPIRVAQVQSNGQLATMVTSKASFAKWRELTLSYTLPPALTQRVRSSNATLSVSGRNLHTWTKYPGFEPEATFNGGSRGGNFAFEQAALPQLTSWLVTLNVGF